MKINPRLYRIVTFLFLNLHKILSFVLGIIFGNWANGLTPESILILGLVPQYFALEIIWIFVLPLFLFSIFYFMLMKTFKGTKSNWFFLGASSTSIFYAWQSLVQIAYLYFENVERFPFNVEGYVFPAIYTFKLFRAIFFSSFFGMLGYLSEILRNKKIIQIT